MTERKISDYYEYHGQLRSSQNESDSPTALITISETYFFRKSDILDLICDKWIPCLLQQRSSPVRILSAGCFSGGGACLLTIKLHKKYLDGMAQCIEVYSCDIDPAVLVKARGACYSSYSFRGVDPSTQQRYFTRPGNLRRLHDEVREKVSFHCINTIREQLLSEVDTILLYNVSVYFDAPMRRELHGNLLRMLQPQGALFFGNTETLASNFDILKLKQEEGIFYFCHHREAARAVSVPRVMVRIPQSGVVIEQTPLVPTAQQSNDRLKKVRASSDEKRFSGAEKCIACVLRDDPYNQDAFLVQGVIAFEQREFSQTAGNTQQIFIQDEQSAEAKMLLDLAAMR